MISQVQSQSTMSETKDVLSLCLRYIAFLGMDSFHMISKLKIAKLVLFFIAVPFYSILLAFAATTTESTEDSIKLIQRSVVFAMMTSKSVNVAMQFEEIKESMEFVTKMVNKIKDKERLRKLINQGEQIAKFSIFFSSVPVIFVHFLSLTMKKLFIPIWIPVQLTGNIFYFNWSFNTFCTIYATSLAMLINILLMYFLVLLKGFSEFLCESFESNKSEYKGLVRKEILQFLENFNDLRR